MLFSYFIDMLLKRLKNIGIGIQIGDRVLSIFGFANDLIILLGSARDF